MEITRGSGNHKNTLKTAWNDVTGDTIKTGKGSHEAYAEKHEGIFGQKKRREYTWDDFPPVGEEQEKAQSVDISREEYLSMVQNMRDKGLSQIAYETLQGQIIFFKS